MNVTVSQFQEIHHVLNVLALSTRWKDLLQFLGSRRRYNRFFYELQHFDKVLVVFFFNILLSTSLEETIITVQKCFN